MRLHAWDRYDNMVLEFRTKYEALKFNSNFISSNCKISNVMLKTPLKYLYEIQKLEDLYYWKSDYEAML